MANYVHQTFQFGETISKEQVDFFNQHGFIHFKGFLKHESLKEVVGAVEKVQQHLLQNQIEKINGIPLRYGWNTDDEPLIQRIAFASKFNSRLHDFLQDERFKLLTAFLGDYEGRIGENEKDGLVVNHYLNHPKSEYKQLGWHTDSPRDIFLGSKILPMLNVGFHLDDCPKSNGGLRVLAGTHNQSLFQLLFRKKYFVDNNPDENEIGFDIEAGDLTIHDGRLWHRVQQSPFFGERSRRRVIYIPIVTGAYRPKDRNSPTPFYHKLAQLQKKKRFNPLNWFRKKEAIPTPVPVLDAA